MDLPCIEMNMVGQAVKSGLAEAEIAVIAPYSAQVTFK